MCLKRLLFSVFCYEVEKDDSEETIRRRLVVYQEQTAPLIQYYEERSKLQSVDGDRLPEEVSAALIALVSGNH